MATLSEGASFGELTLITDNPRNATIYAREECVVGVLEKRDYQKHVGDSFKHKMDKALEVVRRYEIFEGIRSLKSLWSFYYYIVEKHLIKGHKVFSEGDPVDGIYMIVHGEIHKSKQSNLKSSNRSMILSIIADNEVIGLDEIVLDLDKR